MRTFYTILVAFPFLFNLTFGLECYVCKRQDGNKDKCVKTVQTCDQFEDWCLSEVEWGSPPYWQIGADKMYYISKQCATKEHCQRTIHDSMKFCDRISYNDWRCSECCQGDRCNYYVILGASSVKVTAATVMAALAFTFLVWRLT